MRKLTRKDKFKKCECYCIYSKLSNKLVNIFKIIGDPTNNNKHDGTYPFHVIFPLNGYEEEKTGGLDSYNLKAFNIFKLTKNEAKLIEDAINQMKDKYNE